MTGRHVRAAILGAGGFGLRELRGFAKCFGLRVPPTELAEVGTADAGSTSDETALDLQMLTLMAPGLSGLTVYAFGSSFWPVQFSGVLERRNAPDGRLPHVLSVSQGNCESDIGRPELDLTERVLAAAAASGVTVAAGSGDAGSFCPSGKVGFYPASSRWVTSVGGTSLELSSSNRIVAETVWNDAPVGLIGSAGGGGYSRYLRVPFFQRGLADWGGRRGYPDVSAMADGYPRIAIYCGLDPAGHCDPDGSPTPLQALGNGTSAATPLFAGAAALATQRRLDAGRPRLGFIDPLLYDLGENSGGGALRDVVKGTNDIGGGCCDAAPGYDLASGWGSANAEGLADAVAPSP